VGEPPRRWVGKFGLIAPVGQGGFGTVYRARDAELDRPVALKVPQAGTLAGPDDLARFLREARSAAQLRHSGIVPVYEAGQADEVPYLASAFARSVTLADLFSARRPSPAEAAKLAAAAAEVLHHAHAQAVVHRDVKPSNILVDEAGEAHRRTREWKAWPTGFHNAYLEGQRMIVVETPTGPWHFDPDNTPRWSVLTSYDGENETLFQVDRGVWVLRHRHEKDFLDEKTGRYGPLEDVRVCTAADAWAWFLRYNLPIPPELLALQETRKLTSAAL
jgi:serine/threonine protein kinase